MTQDVAPLKPEKKQKYEIKKVHFKILHNIYSCNALLSKYCDVTYICTFCKNECEDICHVFFYVSSLFWNDLSLLFQG